jgi:hypothetical protein
MPCRKGYCWSVNASMRDELLNGELLDALAEAKILIEASRHHSNIIRARGSVGYQPSASEIATPTWPASEGSCT